MNSKKQVKYEKPEEQLKYEEFVRKRINIPKEETDPFCPFIIGYCDVAYSEYCYSCVESWYVFKEKYK